MNLELLRYLAVGTVNTTVGLSVIFLSMYGFDLDVTQANACGYAVGVVVSFSLNRRWTFRHKGDVPSSFAKFVLVLAAAYLCNLGCVIWLVDGLSVNPYVAQALGVAPYVTVGFLGSKLLAFR